jgi:Uma2 family endonuclease
MYQIDPTQMPNTLLPTMYELKSEDPEEPGLPDLFHWLQPCLLSETFHPPNYPADQIFLAADINLYYDEEQTNRYKRPDWYAVLGVPRFPQERNLRSSYVIWEEKVTPFIIVELLSPGTEDEDLGSKLRDVEKPPGKWEVYERILKVPYYVVFDRYTHNYRLFQLEGGRYREARLFNNRFWIPEIQLGLGVWEGNYQGTVQPWLRWYDVAGNWILNHQECTESERQRADFERQRAESANERADFERQRADFANERADFERQRAESERLEKERLIAKLRALNLDPDAL